MLNSITNNYCRTQFNISKDALKKLSTFKPTGCPFVNYTLFDLLNDLINMYSWKICGEILISDFIKMLQDEGYMKALVYGDSIIEILNGKFEQN